MSFLKHPVNMLFVNCACFSFNSFLELKFLLQQFYLLAFAFSPLPGICLASVLLNFILLLEDHRTLDIKLGGMSIGPMDTDEQTPSKKDMI